MSKSVNYQRVEYLTSATKNAQLPLDAGVEVAFIGRSNSGKSSSLNTITGKKALARTSSTPGRTQMLNLFDLGNNCRLVDLPGYGYAKVPKPVQKRWEAVTHEYLETRDCLKGLVLIMDVRHPLKEQDYELITWAASCGVPMHILLSKADKLKNAAKKKTLKEVEEMLKQFPTVTVQLFSSLDREGVDTAKEKLNEWFVLD